MNILTAIERETAVKLLFLVLINLFLCARYIDLFGAC